MEQLLDAAAEIVAEIGYDAATTNAIAARAGVSPGTLYQFFANKEAIAEGLAQRYIDEMRAAHEQAFAASLAGLPFDEVLDRVVDPLIRFELDHPAFHELIADAGAPGRLGRSKQMLVEAMQEQLAALLAGHAPGLSPEQARRSAEVSTQLFKGLIPLVLSAEGEDRGRMITELKRALRGYLAPLMGA